MLHSINLKNFRRHESKTINFADGLNVMKAPNEGGKSTIIEAALYAWFGADALRNSLADTVTWGKKESDLKVELVFEVNNRLFKFTRGKSGAECEYDGGIVTGQKEVSAFAAEILGGDRKTITRLMLANQASMRGALEEGPKAVAVMIEALADFDLFERLADAASTKLLTGSPALLEGKVREAEEAADACNVTAPDLSEFAYRTGEAETEQTNLTNQIAELEPQKRQADADLENAKSQNQLREMAERNLKKAEEALALHKAQKADADAKAAITVDPALIQGLKDQLAGLQSHAATLAVYRALNKLAYPADFWEGTRASMDEEIARLQDQADANTEEATSVGNEIIKAEAEVKRLQGTIAKDTICPTCKRPHDNAADLEAHNAKVTAEIASLKEAITKHKERQDGYLKVARDSKADIAAINAVGKSSAPFEQFAAQHGQYLDVDLNFVPPKLTWKGEAPTAEAGNAQEIQDRIVSLEGAEEAARRAHARSLALAETIEGDEASIARLRAELNACPAAQDTDQLNRVARDLGGRIVVLRDDLLGVQRRIGEIAVERQRVVSQYEAAQARKAEADARLTAARADLDRLHFNNNLLTKIRKARPLISDKLWNTVLTSVSVTFTQMRGVQSVVSKDKDGFKVNGEVVTSLSGSTLDLLGLAIRTALVKTFLPHISLLVLDEPFAACDEARTAAMLGFIASAGFDQTLIVSHEDATEAAADQLITI